MRVVIYVSDEEAEPETQLPQLLAWCAAGGHEVVEEYVDRGVSGATEWRPRFGALLKAASQRQFDCVLAWSVAAFSREGAVETLYLLRQLKAEGIRFFSYSEPRLDDELFAVMASLVRQERLRHGARTREGMARARERGKRIGAARISAEREAAIRVALAAGDRGMIKIAREIGVGVGTVHRVAHERDDRADVGVAVPRVARGPVWR
jgi:DNA invertase Pin-like site-specific DNA recombinase